MRTHLASLAPLLVLCLALAGCSAGGKGGDAASGDFTLAFVDGLAGGRIDLKGAYLRSGAQWTEALGNGTSFTFTGSGGNVTAAGDVPAGAYDRIRLLFGAVSAGGRTAVLSESGVEVGVNVTVLDGKPTTLQLGLLWDEALFESQQGLAFAPVLASLVVTTDGSETTRLQADEIATGSGKAPVARMRIFDATGLEVFASTFVAESPKNRLVGNAGNLTLSATQSEVLQPGAQMASYTWDVGGTTLSGATVSWAAPINGGNVTVRLTVVDSEGNQDTQGVDLALRPGTATRTVSFEGSATGVNGQGVEEHLFPVNTTSLDNVSATLTHVTLVLAPGSATVPVSDLDVTLDDAKAKRIGAQTGTGSQHRIDTDVTDVASGDWKVRVVPDPAYEAAYTVTVTLTWKGVNPGIEAFLAEYDDGHSHEH